jgi:hypothetical protein
VGNLFDAQLAGVSKLKADVNGIITVASSGGIITSSGGIILSGATALFGITSAAGNDVASITSTGEIKMKSSGSIGWTNVAYSNTTPDLVLLRDAASTLAIRDSTNAQTFNVYNTYTDVSNYERARFLWSGNAFYIGTVAAGTGTGRDINLSAGNRLYLGAGGVSNQWHIDTSGHFLATTDNTYDIGATGGTSPKDIYAAGILAAKRGTATPAGGVQAIRLGSTTTLGVFYGSGAPSATAGKGSIYLRSDGSGTTDRAYINTDGGTTWTALTTVA